MSTQHQKLNLALWPSREFAMGEEGKRINRHPGKYLILRSVFHPKIADNLLKSCTDTLNEYGVGFDRIVIRVVPGAFEIPYALAKFHQAHNSVAAAIVLGCIIQGETPHFDHICSSTINSLGRWSLSSDFPLVMGVLTTNTYEEALQRSEPDRLDKGRDFALTALWMAHLEFQNE